MRWNKDYNGGYYVDSIQYQYYNTNLGEFLRGVRDINERFINQAITTAFNDVVNLQTAVGAGLDMWGKVLGFPRYIPIDGETPKDWKNFNFYDTYFKKLKFKNYSDVAFVGLPDYNYRLILLLLKAQQSITPNIKSIDLLVNEIFTQLEINIIVKDTTDMSYITYIFKKEVPDWLGWILKHYDILPRPAGVGANFMVDLRRAFGFDREDIELNKEITNFYYGNFKNANAGVQDGSVPPDPSSDEYISPELFKLFNSIGEAFQKYNKQEDPSQPPIFDKEGAQAFYKILKGISDYGKNHSLTKGEEMTINGVTLAADYYNDSILKPFNLPLITATDDGLFEMK